MTKNEFVELMNCIKDAYPGRFDISKSNGTKQIWYECLEDLKPAIAKKALIAYVQSNTYPPTVADLREKYREIEEQNRRDMARVEEMFGDLADLYPLGYDDELAHGVFLRILGKPQADGRKKTKDQVLNEAERIVTLASDFVHGCKRTGISDVPPLSVYLQTTFGGRE